MPSEGSTIEHGMLVRQWKWPLRVLFWWFMIGCSVLMGSMCAQWMWAHSRAPGRMVEYAEGVLAHDEARLAAIAPSVIDPQWLAEWIASTLEDNLVGAAVGASRALMNWPAQFKAKRSGAPPPGDVGAAFAHEQAGAAGASETVAIARLFIRDFAVRTATFASMAPLLGALVVLAIVDGLVARSIRRSCAGRESASVYHRAKLGQPFVLIMGYLVVLGLPLMLPPEVILVPLAVVVAILLRTQCAFYKKYL